jgi:hypothetical protein
LDTPALSVRYDGSWSGSACLSWILGFQQLAWLDTNWFPRWYPSKRRETIVYPIFFRSAVSNLSSKYIIILSFLSLYFRAESNSGESTSQLHESQYGCQNRLRSWARRMSKSSTTTYGVGWYRCLDRPLDYIIWTRPLSPSENFQHF